MTAVEKIIEYCKKQKNIDLNSHRGVYFNIIRFCEEQALEMEKEQIVTAHYQGYRNDIGITEVSEQYYNETFKSE